MSRPAGEVHRALVDAARELTTPDKSPTVAELASHAQVGRRVAVSTVKNLSRRGQLRIVRTRRVAHTTKPVAEYAPAEVTTAEQGYEFGTLTSAWIRN